MHARGRLLVDFGVETISHARFVKNITADWLFAGQADSRLRDLTSLFMSAQNSRGMSAWLPNHWLSDWLYRITGEQSFIRRR